MFLSCQRIRRLFLYDYVPKSSYLLSLLPVGVLVGHLGQRSEGLAVEDAEAVVRVPGNRQARQVRRNLGRSACHDDRSL